ncbi:MAG: chemotaxis protein CheW [Desulfuromonadales bacterium]|nr:chemotaxis protein CheW [Desulfuromonadales bacterium]
MDIAEIRRKAKGKTGGSAREPSPVAVLETSLETVAEPTAELPPGEVFADYPPAPGTDAAASGLDRLFAATGGVQFASQEDYQTALASQEAREDEGLSQFLAFQLGPEEYALDIARISEIIKPREYTDIPRVPEFILGLISLRGVVVPVFDLRRRFSLGEMHLTAASRIVVCREGDVVAGLLVDSINQVIKLAADKVEPPPAVLSGVDRNLVNGVGRYQGRMIILLNLASVLDVAMA